MKQIETIAIIGAGFLGTQIAARAAVHGTTVRMYDITPAAVSKAGDDVKRLVGEYEYFGMLKDGAAETLGRISIDTDLRKSVGGAELVIESVPENLDLKKKVFAELDGLLPPGALLATNSSSIPVSRLEGSLAHPERVLNIHFYGPVSKNNFADIQAGTRTSPEAVQRARDWIDRIGCVALMVKKECMGFVFNRVWHAVKRECLASWAGGHADFKDLDRAWMIWSGMITGPFAMMDYVGLDVVYDIEMQYYHDSGDPRDRPPDMLKEKTARGELGLKTGTGFYDWKDPEFLKPEFTKKRA